MRSGTSKNIPIPNCCSRKKRSAVCTCPATRWMRTGSSRQSLRPIPSTGEEAHGLDNAHVRIVCTIVKSRMMTTKSNSLMAFTSVEDLTGTMEVIVFPKVLEVFRDAIRENAVVVIEGRLSVREDEPSKLMAESIEGYDPKHPQANRPNRMRDAAQRLYIRLPSRSCPQYAKVVNLLEIFDGDMPVIFYLEDTKQKLAAPRRLYTSGHPLFFQELRRLVGEKNVATK